MLVKMRSCRAGKQMLQCLEPLAVVQSERHALARAAQEASDGTGTAS